MAGLAGMMLTRAPVLSPGRVRGAGEPAANGRSVTEGERSITVHMPEPLICSADASCSMIVSAAQNGQAGAAGW